MNTILLLLMSIAATVTVVASAALLLRLVPTAIELMFTIREVNEKIASLEEEANKK